MIYPKICFSRILCLCFCFLMLYHKTIAQKAGSEKDLSYFLNVEVGAGFCQPLGSFSKNSNVENQAGKCGKGASINLAADAVFHRNFTLGLSLIYGFYQLQNPYLETMVAERTPSASPAFYNSNTSDLSFVTQVVSVTASKIFVLGNLLVQPKVNLGLYIPQLDFISHSSNIIQDSVGFTYFYTYDYKATSYWNLTVMPELNLKYMLRKNKRMDLSLNFGVSYLHTKTETEITETREISGHINSSSDNTFKLTGQTDILNLHLGLVAMF